MPITILLVKKTLFFLVKKTQIFQKAFCCTLFFLNGFTNGPKEFRDNIWIFECTHKCTHECTTVIIMFWNNIFSKKKIVVFVLFVVYYNLKLKDVNKHIHNQGTKKDNLMKKNFKGLFWIFIAFTISWL
jgi:hypothetical protein